MGHYYSFEKGAEIDHRNAEDDDTAPTVATENNSDSLYADYDEEDPIVNCCSLCRYFRIERDKVAGMVSPINEDGSFGLEDDVYEFFIWMFIGLDHREKLFEEEAYGRRKFGDSFQSIPTIWKCLLGQKAKLEQESEVQSIKEDVIMQQKKEKLMCKICYINQLNVLFLPCSHMVACSRCASKLKRCAVCRADIKEALPVYFD